MVTQQMMYYFKFDQADLQANQRMQFTEKQKTRIISDDRSDRTWSWVGGVGLLLIAAIGFFGAVFAGIADNDWGFRIGFGLGFGCIWPLIWGGIGYMVLANSFEKHEFTLARVQGLANIVRTVSHISDHTTSIEHELHIGGQQFDVEGDIANILMQGQEYIIYYIADSSKILSVEAAQ